MLESGAQEDSFAQSKRAEQRSREVVLKRKKCKKRVAPVELFTPFVLLWLRREVLHVRGARPGRLKPFSFPSPTTPLVFDIEPYLTHNMSSSSSKVFSLVGKNLKLDSRADIEPHLKELDAIEGLEEIHLGGNTLGVEACVALAEVLKRKPTLKVSSRIRSCAVLREANLHAFLQAVRHVSSGDHAQPFEDLSVTAG